MLHKYYTFSKIREKITDSSFFFFSTTTVQSNWIPFKKKFLREEKYYLNVLKADLSLECASQDVSKASPPVAL